MTETAPTISLDELLLDEELGDVVQTLKGFMTEAGFSGGLSDAVLRARRMGIPSDRVDRAEARLLELINSTMTADDPPRAVGPGHLAWYASSSSRDRYWGTLKQHLLDVKHLHPDDVDEVDLSSDGIVALLPPPAQGPARRKGLVLGYVQSGKTTNFTAVLAKAADAGYRIFIVLSGMHDGLRAQTQIRIDESLVNLNSTEWVPLTADTDFTGVQSIDPLLSASHLRLVAVVKKNGSRLRRLLAWIESADPELLRDSPVLLIDDEADQASVNTAKPDRSPSVINGLIRDVLEAVPTCAYVGYTATPFANVLIDPTNPGDLYPRDFIVSLKQPSAYIGSERIFGREPVEGSDDDIGEELDCVREIPTDEIPKLRASGKAAADFEPEVTDSLEDALRYFVLSTAARRARSGEVFDATALIHTSQLIGQHERTAEAVRAYLAKLVEKVEAKDAETLAELEDLWEEECECVEAAEFDHETVEWGDLEAFLPSVLAAIRVVVDNSKSLDRLEYIDGAPQVVVVVGGNTLSRGLTLEGLAVSFFLRTSSAYDTLLQMGRWFGYRPGYEDLTRIWMPDDMYSWFHHLATVEAEIRRDIERYSLEHETPETLAVAIRTHPSMTITAASKMQSSVRASISYSGRRIQTILFNADDRDWLETNLEATRALVNETASGDHRPLADGKQNLGLVSAATVLEFLSNYQFHENARELDAEAISSYIKSRVSEGELEEFRVVVMGRSPSNKRIELGSVSLGSLGEVGCINRSKLARGVADYADIKALMSLKDRVIDLDMKGVDPSSLNKGQMEATRNHFPKGYGDGSGLLVIYPISKDSVPSARVASKPKSTRVPLKAKEHVIGIGLVFPETASSSAAVDYKSANLAALQATEIETTDDEDEPELEEVVST
jgi:hypothetical protein